MLLTLSAAAIHFGFTLPQRSEVARAGDEERRLRDEKRELARRLLPFERREAAHARALAALAVAPLPDGSEIQVLRRGVLATLKGERLGGVRVAIRPGRGPVAAAVSLACEGELDSVLRSAEGLVRPGSGLVLSRVRLNATPTGVALDLDASGIRRP
jgi:hypothetical protein